MPRANQDRYNPLGRVPRTLFGHAHESGSSVFPPEIDFSDVAKMHLVIPDNWNGLDKIYLWVSDDATEDKTINVTVNLGTCGEAYNIHTQTVNGIACNITANQYLCIDLTTTHATVLANLAVRDMIQVLVEHAGGDNPIQVFGVELQET